ncbi:hypothetical protein [Bacillus sp. 166amftsu]|uniref:hypothetical protein n=1 Tax=Bacillus sp. 166amftsu TaxID=1761753 RepID=UPI000B832936|nr:hypothetical protein [Bacillus sp. 166amftsu]
MELTKLEKAITIGIILRALRKRKFKRYVDLEKLPAFIKVLDELKEDTTLEDREEATASLINKLMDDLIEKDKE